MNNFDIFMTEHALLDMCTVVNVDEEIKREHFFGFPYSYFIFNYGKWDIETSTGEFIEMPKTFIGPARTEYLYHSKPAHTRYILFRLLPTAYMRVTGLKPSPFHFFSLEKIIDSKRISAIYNKMETMQTAEECYHYFLESFATEIEQWQQPTEIDEVVNYIEINQGIVTVTELIQKFPFSQSSLTRKFKSIVGITPRTYSRLVKFNCFIIELSSPDLDINSLIFKFGYYDLSHLTKDFIQFTGIKPNEYQGENYQLLQGLYANP